MSKRNSTSTIKKQMLTISGLEAKFAPLPIGSATPEQWRRFHSARDELRKMLRAKHNDLLLRFTIFLHQWNIISGWLFTKADFAMHGFDSESGELLTRMGAVVQDRAVTGDWLYNVSEVSWVEVAPFLNKTNRTKFHRFLHGLVPLRVVP